MSSTWKPTRKHWEGQNVLVRLFSPPESGGSNKLEYLLGVAGRAAVFPDQSEFHQPSEPVPGGSCGTLDLIRNSAGGHPASVFQKIEDLLVQWRQARLLNRYKSERDPESASDLFQDRFRAKATRVFINGTGEEASLLNSRVLPSCWFRRLAKSTMLGNLLGSDPAAQTS